MEGIFDNYLEVPDEEVTLKIGELTSRLANPQWINNRLVYLGSLGEVGAQDSLPTEGIPDPLTDKSRAALAEKGILKAIEDGVVTPQEIFKLSHSEDGLGKLIADLLLANIDGRLAPSWGSEWLLTSFG